MQAPVAPAPVVRAPAPAVTRCTGACARTPVAAHPAPSNTELVDKLKVLLSTATPDKKAAELQGAFAALPTIDGVVARTLLVDPLLDWTIVGPVQVDGDILTARLQRTVPFDPATGPVYPATDRPHHLALGRRHLEALESERLFPRDPDIRALHGVAAQGLATLPSWARSPAACRAEHAVLAALPS